MGHTRSLPRSDVPASESFTRSYAFPDALFRGYKTTSPALLRLALESRRPLRRNHASLRLCLSRLRRNNSLLARRVRAADAPDTYVRAGHLLDVRTGKMLSNQIIVIHGDKIASIAPADQVQIPAGATVVDLSRSTVLPGLIDCHTHIMLTDTDDSHYDEILLKQSWQYRTILATLNVKKDLEAGFTAMRDVETEGAMYSDVDVRNAINQGLIPGPRLKVSTRGISTTGGYGLEGYSPEVTVPIGVQTIDGPWEARKAVREQFNYGADLIKIYGTDRYSFTPDGKIVSIADFRLEEIEAIVDEAHLKRIKVACHAYDGPGLHFCIDAGVASIEHGIELDDAAIAKMVKRGFIWFPRSTSTPARSKKPTSQCPAARRAAS